MLEVRLGPDGYTVHDTDADEPIITFASRAEADERIAALQIQDVHAQLDHWPSDVEKVSAESSSRTSAVSCH